MESRDGRVVRVIETPAAALAVAEYVLASKRTTPVLMLAGTAKAATTARVRRLVQSVGSMAECFVLDGHDPALAFSSHLPSLCGVAAGTGRVYDVGHEWCRSPHLAVERFADDGDISRRDSQFSLLLDDAAAAALKAELLLEDGAPRAWEVMGFSGRRVVVSSGDGYATVYPSTIQRGLPPEAVLQPGMVVDGMRAGGECVLVSTARQSACEALDHVRCGDVVPGLVKAVEADISVVEIFPGFEVETRPHPSLAAVDMAKVVSCGAVVNVVVDAMGDTDDQWRAHVACGTTILAQPISLFAGGPHWLTATLDAENVLPPTPRGATVVDVRDGSDGDSERVAMSRVAAEALSDRSDLVRELRATQDALLDLQRRFREHSTIGAAAETLTTPA